MFPPSKLESEGIRPKGRNNADYAAGTAAATPKHAFEGILSSQTSYGKFFGASRDFNKARRPPSCTWRQNGCPED